MASGFPSWTVIFIFSAMLIVSMIAKPCSCSRRMGYGSEWKDEGRDQYGKHDNDDDVDHDQQKLNELNGHDQPSSQIMDPSQNIFFTINNLEVGKRRLLYFSNKDPFTSPRLLPREETYSIPFSSSKLPYLLEFFSLSETSSQAKSMEYTLKECEGEGVKGEVKICVTSLESMLDSLQIIFGSTSHLKVLTTRYTNKKLADTLLQNYTILEVPKEILGGKMVACHTMPYPYAVFFCHGSRESSRSRLFKVSLEGDNGDRVEAVVVCHMNTSEWDPGHVSFRLLKVEPGTCPICHVLPLDDVLWLHLPDL